MVRLRVRAGPNPDNLTNVPVNDASWVDVSSTDFEGRVSVHMKGFEDEKGHMPETDYFDNADRKDRTWSIAFQGRFLRPISADDVLFGNTFDRPIKLPWGSGAALSLMTLVDPTLEQDLQGPKPWALSPLISTMPFLRHRTIGKGDKLPPAPKPETINDEKFSPVTSKELKTASARRSYFTLPDHRKAITFGPTDVIEADFSQSYLEFPNLYLVLPAGVSLDLVKYWDGRAIRFVCCERSHDVLAAKIFWCVVIEIVKTEDDDDDEGEEEEETKDASGPVGGAQHNLSDDID